MNGAIWSHARNGEIDMLHTLADTWSLDIPPDFSRRETDDGFTVFERPDMEVWAVVYCKQPFDPDEAVQKYVGLREWTGSDLPFRSATDGVAGRAYLAKNDNGWMILAVAASHGRVMDLVFRFREREQADAAIAIWHSVRHSAPAWVELCGRADPPLSQLREALEFGFPIDDTIEGILERGQAREARAVLLEATNCGSSTVRQSACKAIGSIGDNADVVMSALRELLDDEVVGVRACAADALLDLGEPPETVVPSMIDGLQKREESLPTGEERVSGSCGYSCVPDRYGAARVLSRIGDAARPARDVLLEHQMDESGCVRLMVAEALLNVGEPNAAVVPPLLDAFHSPELPDRERLHLAEPLLDLGVSHEEVLPMLIHVIEETSDDTTKWVALEAMGRLGAEAAPAAGALETVILQDHEEPSTRTRAARILMQIGTNDTMARPIVMAALDERLDPQTRAEILADLSCADSLESREIARIVQELDDDDLGVQFAASCALSKHGAELDRSLSIFREVLNEPDDRRRWLGVVALGQFGPKSLPALHRLIQFVREEECPEVRMAGIWAIGQIGDYSDEVKSLLSGLSGNADEEEQRIIDDAVQNLQSQQR